MKRSSGTLPKLSLCMIVKNEESVIKDCLESVQGVVGQIVVVDTGSTDNTVEICKKYGAEVYFYRWRDDFSAARNESIKYARGEWILWMDADERLDPGSVEKLKRLLVAEKKPVAYKMIIKNFKPDGSYYFSDAHRLFRNGMGIYFTGVIHEQVSPSVLSLGGELRDTDIIINHLGYSYSGEKEKRKKERNRKLLLKYVNKEPRNAYAHYTLGQFYALEGDHHKALRHYLVAYKLNQLDRPLTGSLLNVMAESYIEIGEYERAEEFALRSMSLCPDQVGCYYLLYKLSSRKEEYSRCLKYLSKMLDMIPLVRAGKKSISSDVVVDESRVLYTRVLCGVKAGKLESAKDDIIKILKMQKVSTPLLEGLLKVSSDIEAHDITVRILERLYELNRERRYLEMIGILYIKIKNFRKAMDVYKRLLDMEPGNKEYIKKLAGLYGKLGDMESASKYVKLLK